MPRASQKGWLDKKIQIQNKQPHLGAKQGIAPADYTISNQNTTHDLRQDFTAEPYRVNNSGSSLSSPFLLQPCTKPFSGWPARPHMTCPTREAGGALRERPGIVYPLLPRAQHPDTSVVVEAALPEAAAVGRQALLAAHCCGYWDHQPATTSAINQETRFQEAIAQAPSQSLYGSVPAAQVLAAPQTLV